MRHIVCYLIGKDYILFFKNVEKERDRILYSFSQWTLIFAAYSLLGWLCESLYCSLRDRRITNRGFLHGPLCPVYGFGGVLILLAAQPWQQYPLLVFLFSFLVTTALEYFTGWLMEALFKLRWWDYSKQPFNIKGRVCLGFSIVFGVMGFVVIYGIQPGVEWLIGLISSSTQRTVSVIFTAVFIYDVLKSSASVSGLNEAIRSEEQKLSTSARRMLHAFPSVKSKEFEERLEQLKEELEKSKRERERQFAKLIRRIKAWFSLSRRQTKEAYKALNFSRMVWVFLICSVVGTIIEMIFCLLTSGVLMSRQGVIYGPFSQIYGFGAVIIVLAVTPIAHKGDRWLFFSGALLGGLYETLAGLIQEAMLGSKSWNYTEHPFALFGGRTNLLYMFFWGILVVIFMKHIYPHIDRLVERIPLRARNTIAIGFSIFMTFDLLISGLAIARWGERQYDIPAENQLEIFMDETYPDEFMREIYPHMVFVDDSTE